jgi:hypothetical protein
MKRIIFWDVMPGVWYKSNDISKGGTAAIFTPKE